MRSASLVDDQLAAQIDVAEARLAAFLTCLDEVSDQSIRRRLTVRAEGVDRRCSTLRATVGEPTPIPIGTPTAVEDLGATMDTLEADLDAATQVEAGPYKAAADRQARAWRGRTDRLRVQAALGVMELKDDLEGLARRLDHVRASALVELREAVSDARDGVEDVRGDMEEVLGDLRRAVDRAVGAIGDPAP